MVWEGKKAAQGHCDGGNGMGLLLRSRWCVLVFTLFGLQLMRNKLIVLWGELSAKSCNAHPTPWE